MRRISLKPIRERNPVAVAVAGLAILAAIGLLTYFSGNLPIIGGGTGYTAYFAEAAGLQPGNEVRIAGVTVGKVTGVTLDGNKVAVTFRVRHEWVGNTSTAAIEIKTLLADQYLGLDPLCRAPAAAGGHPRLARHHPGARHPADRLVQRQPGPARSRSPGAQPGHHHPAGRPGEPWPRPRAGRAVLPAAREHARQRPLVRRLSLRPDPPVVCAGQHPEARLHASEIGRGSRMSMTTSHGRAVVTAVLGRLMRTRRDRWVFAIAAAVLAGALAVGGVLVYHVINHPKQITANFASVCRARPRLTLRVLGGPGGTGNSGPPDGPP